jgi:hypothetical protein
MRDLLTTGGDPLKDATKKALEVLIGFAAASDLTCWM